MNEQLVLNMAKPFVKDGRLTYEQFDVIYEMLSLKEQYQVVEILFCHDIELYDEEAPKETEVILELDDVNVEEATDERHSGIDEDAIRLQISNLFTSPGSSSVLPPEISNGTIKQSNAILCHLIQQGNLQAAQELYIKNRLLVSKYANAFFGYFGNDLSKLYLINDGGTLLKETSTVLGILEALDVLSFNMIGGANSQLYIYINQTRSLEDILNRPWHYQNRLLDAVSIRHLISVKMLTYIYEGNFSSEEIWSLLEDYFLGIIPEKVKRDCRKENPSIAL